MHRQEQNNKSIIETKGVGKEQQDHQTQHQQTMNNMSSSKEKQVKPN